MKIKTIRRFDKDYARLPGEIKDLLDQKVRLFFENQNHPSLRVKKMAGHPNIWEAIITPQYRFSFEVHNNFLILRRVSIHDILNIP